MVEIKVENKEKIGSVNIEVYKDKPIEIKIEGKLTGQHIPRIKRMLSRSYLNWVKSRR